MRYDYTAEEQMRRRLERAREEEELMRTDIQELVELAEELKGYGACNRKATEIMESKTPTPRQLVQHLLAMLKLVLQKTAVIRELRGLHVERMKEIIELQDMLRLPDEERTKFTIEKKGKALRNNK